jgi:hypothetical protein
VKRSVAVARRERGERLRADVDEPQPVHPPCGERVIDEYKRRFAQRSVLRVTTEARAGF